MAQTLGEFLQFMRREVGDFKCDPITAQQWAQWRYDSIISRAPWPWLIKEATFSTVAEITAGTVTVTNGSATVTETTSNANGWSSSVEGRYFRRDGDSEFYPISTFTDANPDTLTLGRVYEGTTGTVLGYEIFQRLYSLASDVGEVLQITAIETPGELDQITMEDLDRGVPNRATLGNPAYWAPAGLDSSNNKRIELYPIPDEAHGMLYQYMQTVPSLADADTAILPQVPYGLLRSGWLADYWSWRAATADSPTGSLSMSNKYEAEFEKRLQEMINRELPNFPKRKVRFARRFTNQRFFRENPLPIELP